MKVLDLLSGMRGWGEPWEKAGHEVIYIDIRPDLKPTFVVDIMDVEPMDTLPWKPDVILTSPPCKKFSVTNINRNWFPDNTPRNEDVAKALRLAERVKYWIEELDPRYFVIENPMGKLRKLDVFSSYERRYITQCRYGKPSMKPTDLWGGFPPSLNLLPPCKNGDTCHLSAPRGSQSATQGMAWELSTKIPENLSNAVRIAVEKDFI